MADRVATLKLVYETNLAGIKQEMADYARELVQNPLKVGISGTSGPAGTFGGGKPASGIGSIAMAPVAAQAAQAATTNYYSHYSPGGVGLGGGNMVPSGSIWAPRTGGGMTGTTPFMGSPFVGGFQPTLGPGVSPAYSPQVQGSFGGSSGGPVGPWMSNGSFFSNGGGGGGGGAGGGWFPSFSRAGMRQVLGQEGLRGLGRYIGAYGVANVATSWLNQQNQYAMSTARATTTGDFVESQIAYQKNSPWAQLPVVGSLGSAFRESTGLGLGQGPWYTGTLGVGATQAGIAGMQTQQGIEEETGRIATSRAVSKLDSRASLAALRGDFQGQREANDLENQAAKLKSKTDTSAQITKLTGARDESLNYAGETSTMFGSDINYYAHSEKERHAALDKASALTAQINQINQTQADSDASDDAKHALRQAAIQRAESADTIGSAFRIAADKHEFSDERVAGRIRLQGSYESRISGAVGGSDEQKRAIAERDAALGNYDRQYSRETGYIQTESGIAGMRGRASQLSAFHQNYAAGMQGFSADAAQARLEFSQSTAGLNVNNPDDKNRYDAAFGKLISALDSASSGAQGLAADFNISKEQFKSQHISTLQMMTGARLDSANTATDAKYAQLIHDHPELTEQYERARGDERADNQIQSSARNANIALGTLRIKQSGDSQELRNQHRDLAASVLDTINAGADEIREDNIRLGTGQLTKEQYDQDIKQIRRRTLLGAEGATQKLKYGASAQETNAFNLYGNRNNQYILNDVLRAREEAKNAGKDLDKAAKELPTVKLDGNLESNVASIVTALNTLAQNIQNALN